MKTCLMKRHGGPGGHGSPRINPSTPAPSTIRQVVAPARAAQTT
ncbi:hypothetical protein [Pigmentiphaga litoralis]